MIATHTCGQVESPMPMVASRKGQVLILVKEEVRLSFSLPTTILEGLAAHVGDDAETLEKQVADSLEVLAYWQGRFNEPCCRVPSVKSRLKALRPLLSRLPLVRIEVTLPALVWSQLQAKAEEYGITAGEACIAAVEYRAKIWDKLRPTPRAASPVDSFEKKLGEQHRRKRHHGKEGRKP